MSIKIGLIDYGMGNLHSVQTAFNRINVSLEIIRSPNEIETCNALILPGVGAFDPAVEQLEKANLFKPLQEWGKLNKPLLGICLGLQLLFESSSEGQLRGLGIFKGKVIKLSPSQRERVPHMGWSKIVPQSNYCPLLSKSETNNWLYFVHSFSAIPKNSCDLAASTQFGDFELTAMIWKGNIGACQFHPEKSGKTGEIMLIRWINWLNKITKS